MKHFTEWMEEGRYKPLEETEYQQTPALILADGTTLSIQASFTHYCCPRVSTEYRNYVEFEIGFPNRKIPSLMPYVEDEDNPTETVYAYVPADVVQKVIDECGGVVAHKGRGE